MTTDDRILAKLGSIEERLVRIELAQATARGEGLKERVEGLETRVRTLEVWRGVLAGGLIVVGVVVPYVMNLLSSR